MIGALAKEPFMGAGVPRRVQFGADCAKLRG
jgi:hypothetical protein